MIENEDQRRVALSWISYWRDSVSAGEQSWLAGEQARAEIMRLRRKIAEYDKRAAVV